MPTTRPEGPAAIDAAVSDEVRQGILGAVGYGRPPKSKRFQKGRSGNPAGRPRKHKATPASLQIQDVLLAEAERTVAIAENGEEHRITVLELVVKAQVKSAARGNSYAQAQVLDRIEKAQRARAITIEAGNMAASDYIETCRGAIAAAHAEGRPHPQFYPHPDDVIIEAGKPFRINGPSTKDDATHFDRACKVRDILIMQTMLAPRPSEGSMSVELLLAIRINDALPERMQIDEMSVLLRQLQFQRIGKQELARHVQDEWCNLGIKARRGWTFPQLDEGELVAQLSAAASGDPPESPRGK